MNQVPAATGSASPQSNPHTTDTVRYRHSDDAWDGRAPTKIRTILLVDGQSASRELNTAALAGAGFQVEEAPTAENALERASTIKPSVVIADLPPYGMDSFELCQRLQRRIPLRDTLMIVLTSSTNEEAQHQAEGAGRLTVLTKPILPAELVVAVKDALKAFDTLPLPRSS